MCGIIGFTGHKNCVPHLLDALSSLEYRGYDSAGIAYSTDEGIRIIKTSGKIEALKNKIKDYETAHCNISGDCGIGHTRWATHGEPSDVNSHPHRVRDLTLVHNGIIENYAELKESLAAKGYTFLSETDTEIAAAQISLRYSETSDPIKALHKAAEDIRGSFAFGVIFDDYPHKIYAIRRDSPLVAAAADGCGMIASDITAILPHTRKYFPIPENAALVIDGDEIFFFDRFGRELDIPEEEVTWSTEDARRGGYPHFMLKEIFEEPHALRETFASKMVGNLPAINSKILSSRIGTIHIAACGTAMHAGLFAKHYIEKLAKIPVTVNIASEFRYCDPLLDGEDIVLLISQSGETADTLASLRLAKSREIRTLSLVNVAGSAIARESDEVIYTCAGPEIAVASTKAYIVQCASLYLLALDLALKRGMISAESAEKMCSSFVRDICSGISSVFDYSVTEKIDKAAEYISARRHVFYIGRGIDSHLCTEGSLKLKEISYIHSEAYAAGEMKHGTISLIEDGVPVIAIITEISTAEKMISGIREVKSRGGYVIAFVSEEIADKFEIPYDEVVSIPCPSTHAHLPIMTALQLMAYKCAVKLGLDPDKPRNLAKSVTVE
ncbi:MAG: glutamine--fructose-6-phosphate transaminase (isomerizing) [Ruminococcaceae bacterium]|nr:glutamine--fructose-6-phosphate transaminase (isomerizing) [Oscillospiraceae bacterium]